MRIPLAARGVCALVWLASGPAWAQTQLLTNNSFESGLTGWTTATSVEDSATGTCGYNGTTAAGTETITGQPAYSPTDGTQLAMGDVAQATGGGAVYSCVLYQDVAIPAGATTATFSFDMGIKNTPGNNTNNGAAVGIFSTTTVPGFATAAIVGGGSGKVTLTTGHSADAALTHQSSASIDISARAGTTVRFAIINAANTGVTAGHEVIGVDNVQFLVNTSSVPQSFGTPTPDLSQGALLMLGGLLAAAGFYLLRRRFA